MEENGKRSERSDSLQLVGEDPVASEVCRRRIIGLVLRLQIFREEQLYNQKPHQQIRFQHLKIIREREVLLIHVQRVPSAVNFRFANVSQVKLSQYYVANKNARSSIVDTPMTTRPLEFDAAEALKHNEHKTAKALAKGIHDIISYTNSFVTFLSWIYWLARYACI
jgi:hypothetical protein